MSHPKHIQEIIDRLEKQGVNVEDLLVKWDESERHLSEDLAELKLKAQLPLNEVTIKAAKLPHFMPQDLASEDNDLINLLIRDCEIVYIGNGLRAWKLTDEARADILEREALEVAMFLDNQPVFRKW